MTDISCWTQGSLGFNLTDATKKEFFFKLFKQLVKNEIHKYFGRNWE